MENVTVSITGDSALEVFTDTGGYYGFEVYNGGAYTVTPDLAGWVFEPSSYTYSPLAHRMFGQDFANGRWSGITGDHEVRDVMLEVEGSTVRFSLPQSTHISLSVYDLSGRKREVLMDGSYQSGSYHTNMPDLEPGVYFVRLNAVDVSITEKVVVNK
jgi:hypothetical protein